MSKQSVRPDRRAHDSHGSQGVSSTSSGPVRGSGQRDKSVLLNTTPGWLNWAAVSLAVLIVAGVFVLSARQLNAPEAGVSANQNLLNGMRSSVGGMRLDGEAGEGVGQVDTVNADSGTDASAGSNSDAGQLRQEEPLLRELEPGLVLINPTERVRLYADTDTDSVFLDSFARGGTFVVIEPTGDFEDYPVIVEEAEWVRVRASDGLVGWTHVSALEPVP